MSEKKIRYEWTGEFRPPKVGEWHLSFRYHGQPIQAEKDWMDCMSNCRWILRCTELPDAGASE